MKKLLPLLILMSLMSAQEPADIQTDKHQFSESYLKNGYTLEVRVPVYIKPFIFIIDFYQNYLGRIKGSYCPMYPSCSEYGKNAILNNRFEGILMTFDRLHRCSHDLHIYEVIIIDGRIKYIDEVHN